MPKGLSLHIGLNKVNPAHYQGWSGPLTACEADAMDMNDIAVDRGFSPAVLLTSAATRKKVIKAIDAAAKKLKSGDIFFLSYSGHGGQLPDRNGDEADQQDETWCLYDGQLVDDEIYKLLGQFRSGVRILVLSDSCHSGTVVKAAYHHGPLKSPNSMLDMPNSNVYRAMPSSLGLRVYQANKALYDPILKNYKLNETKGKVQASVILLSGCQDNQFSADGAFNGLFTGTLLQVWNGGEFSRGYRDFHGKIVKRMPPDQTPKYFKVGASNPAFEAQKPFKI